MGREDAPLLFRLRWDRALFDWSWRFLRECTPGRTRRNIEDIVRLDWNQVLSADSSGAGHNLVTSIARLILVLGSKLV